MPAAGRPPTLGGAALAVDGDWPCRPGAGSAPEDTMAVGSESTREHAMAVGAEHEVPPPAAMMGLITGYWVSQAVGVVAQLGVADQLGQGPRASDELARAVGADPQALYRVLRLLASIGV